MQKNTTNTAPHAKVKVYKVRRTETRFVCETGRDTDCNPLSIENTEVLGVTLINLPEGCTVVTNPVGRRDIVDAEGHVCILAYDGQKAILMSPCGKFGMDGVELEEAE